MVVNSFKYLDIITALFVAVLIISNIADTKIITIGLLSFGGGTFLFPLTYIIGDILTEVYGFARARRVIWIGFVCAALMAVTFMVVAYAPPAEDWPFQESFMNILGLTPRIVVASLSAYLVGELVNSIILAKLKVKTAGRFLWLRTISSTIVGQFLDTVIFVIIAFYGVFPVSLLVSIMISGYLLKVATEVFLTPVTYLAVNKLKKAEKIDFYDKKTSFNPFSHTR